MAKSLPVENLLPQNMGQISTNCSNATEVTQRGAPSCGRPQPATDNGVIDRRYNWMTVTLHHTQEVPLELHVLHGANAGHKLQDLLPLLGRERPTIGMPGQSTDCAATRGISMCDINGYQWNPHEIIPISHLIVKLKLNIK